MAAPADAIFVDGEVHLRPGEDRTAEALAVRDGTVCRVADTYEVEFLEGIETRRVDLDGRTVLPGFVDGYAHLLEVGQRLRGSEDDGMGIPPQTVEQARENLTAAFDYALEQGITTVYDAIHQPETARAYHELALADELPIRARLNYLGNADSAERPAPLDAARTLGLVSGVGTELLHIESLEIDASEQSADGLRDFIERATETGFHVSATAEEADALEPILTALEGSDGNRPRIWLGGEATEDHVQALADRGATVVGRPGHATGSGDQMTATNGGDKSQGPQFGRLVAAGIPVAFGSKHTLPDPLRDIERATSAGPDARLGVTEAVRAATDSMGVVTGAGGTPAAPESANGTLDVGTPADFVVLSDSPWETPIADLAVELTVIDGAIRNGAG